MKKKKIYIVPQIISFYSDELLVGGGSGHDAASGGSGDGEDPNAAKHAFGTWDDADEAEGTSTTKSSSPEGSISNNPGNFHYFTGRLWSD